MKNKNLDRIFFFGSFTFFSNGNSAYAASGSQVQLEIIKNLKNVFSSSLLYFFIFEPNKTWPFSKIYISKKNVDKFKFHSYVNIKGIRESIILFNRIFKIFLNKPSSIFIYNISFIEALVYYLLKKWFKFKVVLFIQDVNQENLLQKFLNIYTFKFASNFDLLIPITSSIIEDFKLPINKTILFSGGCTEIAFSMQKIVRDQNITLLPRAVFAGRLEKYNGIDKIVEYWIRNSIQFELHIYGIGSYKSELKSKLNLNTNIKYFGLVSDWDVFNIQRHSALNFCLRYSINLNQNYFFPSKLYNLMSAPGTVLINKFNNIPEEMLKYLVLLDENFSNLQEVLDNSSNFERDVYLKRIAWLNQSANWSDLMISIKLKLS